MLITLIAWTFVFFIFFSSGDFLINIFNRITRRSEKYGITDRPFSSIIYTPYTLQPRVNDLEYTAYQMDNITVHISMNFPCFTYDKLPATGAPNEYKYQPVNTVEARGHSIKYGFRPKKSVN